MVSPFRSLHPNGQTTSYSYFSGTADPRLQTIWHKLAGGTTLSKFDYGYNAVGDMVSWQKQADANPAAEDDFGYDGIDQLLSATRKDVTSGTVQKQYTYGYDAAGNRTVEQVDAAIASGTYNNLNQLTARSGAGPMTFEGTLNEPATVTVGGNAAKVTSLGGSPATFKFQGTATVSAGAQSVTISATDPSGNTTTKQAQLTVTEGALTQSFTYDDDGNLLSDGIRSFVYDAENRIVKVTIGTDYQEFVYNGIGQRVAEKMNGGLTKQFVWDGYQLREERDASNNVTKRFYGQGEQIGGTAYFFTRDHLGSIRELTDGAGAIRARYDYDAWGRRTKLSGDLEADFSYTGHYWDAFASVNLTYYRAYDPDLGRWLSRDPIREGGGLNLYSYVLNAPLNAIDPLGLVNLNLFVPGSAEYWDAQATNISDMYSVAAHGSWRSLSDQRGMNRDPEGAGEQDVSPQELADMIKRDPNYDPSQPVALLSCSAGRPYTFTTKSGHTIDNYAQELADALGNTVYAPTTDLLWQTTYRWGGIFPSLPKLDKSGKILPYAPRK